MGSWNQRSNVLDSGELELVDQRQSRKNQLIFARALQNNPNGKPHRISAIGLQVLASFQLIMAVLYYGSKSTLEAWPRLRLGPSPGTLRRT